MPRGPSNIYRSMKLAAADLGVDINVLKICQEDPDCTKAFMASGRITKNILKEFVEKNRDRLVLESQKQGSYDYWREQKVKYAALLAKKELEISNGEFIRITDIHQDILAVALAQKALLKSKMLTELPPQLVGLTQPEMTKILEAALSDICNLLSNMDITKYDTKNLNVVAIEEDEQ